MGTALSRELLSTHLEEMKGGLRFLLKGVRQAGKENRGNGGLVFFVDHEHRAVNMRWLGAEEVPDNDVAIKSMTEVCHAGDISVMTVIIPHRDGGHSGYMISPLVMVGGPAGRDELDYLRGNTYGYVVLFEAHYPAGQSSPSVDEFRVIGGETADDWDL